MSGELDKKIDAAVEGLFGSQAGFVEKLQPEAIVRRMCWLAAEKAKRNDEEPWQYIKQATSHGSGMAHAIFEVYGPNED